MRMSGHSKWANIKHKKGKADAQRGALFTKIAREIIVAAREGGPDPDANFRLRLAIDKAKANNVPNDNISRAVKRANANEDGSSFATIFYEGYGPAGVAVMVETLTDNKNRTAGDVRHVFSKHGGNLGENGCVGWLFDRKGVVVLEHGVETDIDQLMLAALELGAEDVREEDDATVEILTAPDAFQAVEEGVRRAGYVSSSAEITMVPQTTVQLGQRDAEKMLKMMDAFEDLDDVQNVYANFDIPDAVMEALS